MSPPQLLLRPTTTTTHLNRLTQLARLTRTPASTLTTHPAAVITRFNRRVQLTSPPITTPTRSSVRFNSSSPSSSSSSAIKDDTHPHLYFHQVPHPSSSSPTTTRIALSYLPRLPKSPTSSAIIGWLPNDAGAGVGEFVENPGFRTLLNKLIPLTLSTPGLAQSVEVEALARGGDGFMHIGDERNLPPSGRIPVPEDIIGSVYVRDGKPLPETYEAQPMHRLLTQDGVTILPYGIDEYVVGVLEKEE